MLLRSEKINAGLLFIISFSITVLVIYLIRFNTIGSTLEVSHSFIKNVLFINFTFLGSGIFCIVLLLYLFYIKQNIIARLVMASSFITIFLIQSIKNYFHQDGLQFFFEDEQYLFNLDPQKEMAVYISSHTAIAFTLATVFTLYFNSRIKGFLLFTAAYVVAYSRIYLSPCTIPDALGVLLQG